MKIPLFQIFMGSCGLQIAEPEEDKCSGVKAKSDWISGIRKRGAFDEILKIYDTGAKKVKPERESEPNGGCEGSADGCTKMSSNCGSRHYSCEVIFEKNDLPANEIQSRTNDTRPFSKEIAFCRLCFQNLPEEKMQNHEKSFFRKLNLLFAEEPHAGTSNNPLYPVSPFQPEVLDEKISEEANDTSKVLSCGLEPFRKQSCFEPFISFTAQELKEFLEVVPENLKSLPIGYFTEGAHKKLPVAFSAMFSEKKLIIKQGATLRPALQSGNGGHPEKSKTEFQLQLPEHHGNTFKIFKRNTLHFFSKEKSSPAQPPLTAEFVKRMEVGGESGKTGSAQYGAERKKIPEAKNANDSSVKPDTAFKDTGNPGVRNTWNTANPNDTLAEVKKTGFRDSNASSDSQRPAGADALRHDIRDNAPFFQSFKECSFFTPADGEVATVSHAKKGSSRSVHTIQNPQPPASKGENSGRNEKNSFALPLAVFSTGRKQEAAKSKKAAAMHNGGNNARVVQDNAEDLKASEGKKPMHYILKTDATKSRTAAYTALGQTETNEKLSVHSLSSVQEPEPEPGFAGSKLHHMHRENVTPFFYPGTSKSLKPKILIQKIDTFQVLHSLKSNRLLRSAKEESLSVRHGNMKISSKRAFLKSGDDTVLSQSVLRNVPVSEIVTAAGKSVYHSVIPVRHETIIKQLLSAVSNAGQKKMSRVKIALDPPSLGSLDMDIIVRDKTVRVQFTVQSAEVSRFINFNLEQLKQSLAGQGLYVDSITVNDGSQEAYGHRSGPDSEGRFFHSEQRRQNQTGGNATAESDPPYTDQTAVCHYDDQPQGQVSLFA
ncbi:MAG: flagellar hook-length control protein FliK [Syntrophales bacterium]|nr:flagellar hook-length control protein FliK [Syntrophales bacterium]MDY0043104.1 flagellar hook-length control protein FliK [Syntrophales bacterium]